ncbi:hypothetical protein SAMN02927921_02787 [Sinomicrobium oceani]|uniref:Uncharacterized protein n=1 Tax=Sinomicrobium oceani TaxID=1150368 RepID=A0A1K1QSD5_9FLAO|nr:hypothetical protein SAMN02927921_02787 [Sinomicrobium oceani]
MAYKTGCKIRTFYNVNQLFEGLNFRASFCVIKGGFSGGWSLFFREKAALPVKHP